MDQLNRRELQKLCVERRSVGLLPKGTKCNGSREELLRIIQGESPQQESSVGIRKKPQILDESSKLSSTYEKVLSYLAPYLTYDKLLLMVAYYPKHPLLKQLRDPKGKIWSDRVWVEIGEAPVSIRKYGTRYYSLWANQTLLPWGNLVVNSIVINVWCQFVSVQIRKETKEPRQEILTWARTPRGLEFSIISTLILLGPTEEEVKALEDPGRWKRVSGEDYLFVGSHNYGSVLALNQRGEVHKFSYENSRFSDEIIKRNVHYLRMTSYVEYFYGTTFEGDHFILDSDGRELKVQHHTTYNPGGRLYPSRGGPFDEILIRSSGGYYSLGNYGITYDKAYFEHIKGVEHGKLYYLPMFGLDTFKESTRTLPRACQVHKDKRIIKNTETLLLGLDGAIYREVDPDLFSVHLLILVEDLKRGYELKYRPPNGKLQSFTYRSFMSRKIVSGIVW